MTWRQVPPSDVCDGVAGPSLVAVRAAGGGVEGRVTFGGLGCDLVQQRAQGFPIALASLDDPLVCKVERVAELASGHRGVRWSQIEPHRVRAMLDGNAALSRNGRRVRRPLLQDAPDACAAELRKDNL